MAINGNGTNRANGAKVQETILFYLSIEVIQGYGFEVAIATGGEEGKFSSNRFIFNV
jgi:hypothetical protein